MPWTPPWPTRARPRWRRCRGYWPRCRTSPRVSAPPWASRRPRSGTGCWSADCAWVRVCVVGVFLFLARASLCVCSRLVFIVGHCVYPLFVCPSRVLKCVKVLVCVPMCVFTVDARVSSLRCVLQCMFLHFFTVCFPCAPVCDAPTPPEATKAHVLKRQNKTVQDFDDMLYKMRRDQLRLEADLGSAALRFVTLYQVRHPLRPAHPVWVALLARLRCALL
jgi:hypothetical protein